MTGRKLHDNKELEELKSIFRRGLRGYVVYKINGMPPILQGNRKTGRKTVCPNEAGGQTDKKTEWLSPLDIGIATSGHWHCHLWTLASPPLDVDVAMSGRRHCLGWTNFVPFINRRKEGIDILSSVFYFVPLSYGRVTWTSKAMQSTAIRTVADSLPGNEIIKSQVVLSRIFGHTNNNK